MLFLKLLFLGLGAVFAAEKPSDVTNSGQVDEMITNNSLRAMSGSKSRWSFASTWNYNGGNLASAFAQDRPNISGASATTAKTDIDGALNIKYGFDKTHAIFAGFGFRYISPFNSSPGANYTGQRLDAMNPNVIFQYLYSFHAVQAVLQAKALQWTQSDQTVNGYAQQFAIDQESVWVIGKSGFSFGLSSVVSSNTFNKSGTELASAQSQYQVQLSPYMEYILTPRYNLRTILNLFSFEKYRSADTWVRDTVIQSVGVGISFTRDIFFYPSVSFVPFGLAANRTNVGASLTLNLF